jgi:hypothetical protein
MSHACHRIDIEPVSIGDRGRRYGVHHAGAVLSEDGDKNAAAFERRGTLWGACMLPFAK